VVRDWSANERSRRVAKSAAGGSGDDIGNSRIAELATRIKAGITSCGDTATRSLATNERKAVFPANGDQR